MKTGQIILLVIVTIAIAVSAFFLGRSLPNGQLKAEIKILGNVIQEQNESLVKMDSTIQTYREKMMEFVIDFDSFKIEQEVLLNKMTSSITVGKKFQEDMLTKLISLSQRRDSLAAEAARFNY